MQGFSRKVSQKNFSGDKFWWNLLFLRNQPGIAKKEKKLSGEDCMVRKISNRMRLYFCPDCGALVSCTRKQRRHPGRVCRPEKCVDYAKCRLRITYQLRKFRSMFSNQAGERRFYKKYSVHYIQCSGCRQMESLIGAKSISDKLTI